MCHELIILKIDLQSMSRTQLDLQSVCHELKYMCIYIYTYIYIYIPCFCVRICVLTPGARSAPDYSSKCLVI